MLFLLISAVPMIAQVDAESSYKAVHRYKGIGVKGGVFLPDYYYLRNSALNSLPKDTLRCIRPVAGVQFEIPFGTCFYIAPELMYIRRGDARSFHNVPYDDEIEYAAFVNYLDLRVPLAFVVPLKKAFKPYLFAGVDLGMVLPYFKNIPLLNRPLNLSGFITENEKTVDVNASNMAPFDVGVLGGLGARYTIDFDRFSLVLKLELAYSFGLLNTFSSKEINSEVPAVNLGSGGTHYAVGNRHNRGMECTFGVVLPLHFLDGDACSFGDSRYNTRRKGHSYGF